MNAIYFDMDGTIYDLYNVDNWEYRLNHEDVTAYAEGAALYDMEQLNALLEQFVALGFVIGVITWTAMNGSKEYNKATRKVKRGWIAENLPCVSEFHCVKYGTPKHYVCNIKDSILVDDNAEVRAKWKGETIDACEDIIEELKNILAILD
jgi:predicted phosphatase